MTDVPELRASDTDREHAAELLRRAAGEGRLTVDELDDRLHQLEDHIDDAQAKADPGRADAEASRVVAGDWDDTAPDRPLGDDPEGAVEDGEPAKDE